MQVEKEAGVTGPSATETAVRRRRRRTAHYRGFYRPQPVAAAARAKRRRSVAKYLFLLPALVYLLVLFLYPIIYNVFISVQKYSAISFIQNSSQFNGIANYVDVFSNPTIWHVFIDTALFIAISLVFQYAFGLALAIFFSRRFPLNSLLRSLILIPWLLPPLVGGTVLRFMFQTQSGMVNRVLTGLGIISQPVQWLSSPRMALVTVIIASVWLGIPFNMVLLYSGIREIPKQLFEAADIDGANAYRKLRHLTLPMLRNVSAVVILLGIIYTMKSFDQIYVLTGGGPANATQVLSTWSYTLSFLDSNFGQGAVVGNIMMVLSLVSALIYVKIYGKRALA